MTIIQKWWDYKWDGKSEYGPIAYHFMEFPGESIERVREFIPKSAIKTTPVFEPIEHVRKFKTLEVWVTEDLILGIVQYIDELECQT